MTTYLLVSFKTCPWVQRAAIVLREKKVDFEFKHIEPDNRPDWLLAISPHKKVPVLRIDDRVSLFESNAIAEYLDETIAPRLHPADPIQRAINRAWTDYIPTFAKIVTATAYADSEADYHAAAAKIPVPFERLEKALEKQVMSPIRGRAPTSTAPPTRWWTRATRRSSSATRIWTASRSSAISRSSRASPRGATRCWRGPRPGRSRPPNTRRSIWARYGTARSGCPSSWIARRWRRSNPSRRDTTSAYARIFPVDKPAKAATAVASSV